MTMHLTESLTLNDGRLLALLSAGDAVAQELKYHPGCLATLYNRERACKNAESSTKQVQHKKEAHPIAFAELVCYIFETKTASEESSNPPVFRLADLVHFYKERLKLVLKQYICILQD